MITKLRVIKNKRMLRDKIDYVVDLNKRIIVLKNKAQKKNIKIEWCELCY